jgi:hypothetical protein
MLRFFCPVRPSSALAVFGGSSDVDDDAPLSKTSRAEVTGWLIRRRETDRDRDRRVDGNRVS